MEKNNLSAGHLAAVVSIFIWGTTFISTKLLLVSFSPAELLFFRFSIGTVALLAAYPRAMPKTTLKQELTLAGAGLCGVTLYFLMENIALTYTLASNVSVILSTAPFFTAILAYWFLNGEKPTIRFFAGFACSILGILLISYNGAAVLRVNPKGDILAVLAAIFWAGYSVLTKKISGWGFHTIQTTRRIFFYGLLFMVPALFFLPFRFGFERFATPVNLINILYLGLGASALCFVTWNFAVKKLGAIKTSVYIYLVPVIAIIASALVLQEPVTAAALAGAALTLGGLFLSEKRPSKQKAPLK